MVNQITMLQSIYLNGLNNGQFTESGNEGVESMEAEEQGDYEVELTEVQKKRKFSVMPMEVDIHPRRRYWRTKDAAIKIQTEAREERRVAGRPESSKAVIHHYAAAFVNNNKSASC
ncbi:hypothetical protein AOLI_G00065010 [Acnodon oligacanthus]